MWGKAKKTPSGGAGQGRPAAETGPDPDGLLEGIPRGRIDRKFTEQELPLARFEEPGEVARDCNLAYGRDAVFLGVSGGQACEDENTGEPYVQGGAALGLRTDQHVTIVAGSRTGKGRSILIPNLLAGYKGSVLVNDPKAELATMTALARERMGQKVCILDPFGIAPPELWRFRGSWNPMAFLTPKNETLVEDAGLLSDACVILESRDPHWDESARSWIEGLILHVATSHRYEGERDLGTVRRLMMRGADPPDGEGMNDPEKRRDALRHEMLHAELSIPSVQDAAAEFFERAEGEGESVASTARRHTKFLSYPSLVDVLRGDPAECIDLAELKTAPRGMTVYLCLPAERLSMCQRWLRLFVNVTFAMMERTRVDPEDPGKTGAGVPVLLMLDEFPVLEHMRQIEVAAGLMAGFGVKLLTVLQDLSQLRRYYRESWETFLGNSGAVILFGNNDNTTLEWASKRLGDTSLKVGRQSSKTRGDQERGALGESTGWETRPLMTPEEIARIFGRDDKQQRMLVIRPGRRPLIVQRVKYDLHAFFAGGRP